MSQTIQSNLNWIDTNSDWILKVKLQKTIHFFTGNIHSTIGREMIAIWSEIITIWSSSALFFVLFEIKQIDYHLNHHLNGNLQINTERYNVDWEILRKYDNLQIVWSHIFKYLFIFDHIKNIWFIGIQIQLVR